MHKAVCPVKGTAKTSARLPCLQVHRVASLQGHVGAVHCVALLPDTPYLLTGGQDGLVRVWSVPAVSGTAQSSSTAPSLASLGNAVHTVLPDASVCIGVLPILEGSGGVAGGQESHDMSMIRSLRVSGSDGLATEGRSEAEVGASRASGIPDGVMCMAVDPRGR